MSAAKSVALVPLDREVLRFTPREDVELPAELLDFLARWFLRAVTATSDKDFRRARLRLREVARVVNAPLEHLGRVGRERAKCQKRRLGAGGAVRP